MIAIFETADKLFAEAEISNERPMTIVRAVIKPISYSVDPGYNDSKADYRLYILVGYKDNKPHYREEIP